MEHLPPSAAWCAVGVSAGVGGMLARLCRASAVVVGAEVGVFCLRLAGSPAVDPVRGEAKSKDQGGGAWCAGLPGLLLCSAVWAVVCGTMGGASGYSGRCRRGSDRLLYRHIAVAV